MSQAEETLAWQINALHLPTPEREYRFARPRRWRFDFCWPDLMLACEVEGGTWIDGRHSRGKGMAADCEKYAEAWCLGYAVLRVTTDQVKSGQAVAWIQRKMEVCGKHTTVNGLGPSWRAPTTAL